MWLVILSSEKIPNKCSLFSAGWIFKSNLIQICVSDLRDEEKSSLPFSVDYGRIFLTRGRGVVANMRPCQGRDRGFEPRRSRQSEETFRRGSFFIVEIPVSMAGIGFEPRPDRMLRDRSRQSEETFRRGSF